MSLSKAQCLANTKFSDEQPFEDSGSEYLPSKDEESEEDDMLIDEYQDVMLVESVSEDSNHELETDLATTEKDYADIKIIWGDSDFVPTIFEFDPTNSGIRNDSLSEKSIEFDYFASLFTEDIVEYIVTETNRYANQNQAKDWKELSTQEFYVFIGLTMLMSRNKKTNLKEYWSTDSLLESPIFSRTMPRDKYMSILSNLHFVNNEKQPTTKLYKVEKVLKLIKENFQKQFYPFENLVVDESMVLFKGRLSFKQYIKTKRHRFGMKLYVLCECETGMVLDFVVYVGNDTKQFVEEIKGLGSSGYVVVSLMKPYLEKGHKLFTDNYYSSPILANYLFEKKTNTCGTVRENRKYMPTLKKN
nr:piggyBac transposable element-derived protein 4-like [Onthophagus taurus]